MVTSEVLIAHGSVLGFQAVVVAGVVVEVSAGLGSDLLRGTYAFARETSVGEVALDLEPQLAKHLEQYLSFQQYYHPGCRLVGCRSAMLAEEDEVWPDLEGLLVGVRLAVTTL